METTTVAPAMKSATRASNDAQAIFDRAFTATTKEIEFDRNWSNGTGLFDYAVYGEFAPKLAAGTMVKSVTPNGRRLLLIGTRLGNVVVFERYMGDPKKTKPIFCQQSTSNVVEGGWFSGMTLDEYELEIAVGTDTEHHIGKRIDLIFSAMKKTS